MPRRIIKKFKRFFNLEKDVSRFPLFGKKEKENLGEILCASQECAEPALKLKIYELLLELREKIKKPFGMLVVLGWRREFNEKHYAVPDITQNLFHGLRFDLAAASFARALETLKMTADFDGAVLVSREGLILASGVYLGNIGVKEIAERLHPDKSEDLSAAFGFMKKVHTRHLAAVASSWVLRGTTAFALSEEDRSLRIFERGRIIWSTDKEELNKIIQEKHGA